MDVPITLSALSGEAIRDLGVTDIGQLSAYVPGLNVQIQSANNPGFVIRGITSDSGSAQESPRVTLYYNGVDISRSRGAYQGIYDMERIEVVKGPQATLFGTAATIGAISLISNKPQPGLSASATAGVGNYGARKLEGFVNAGNDVIAARLAWQWLKRDGYVKNLAPDQDDLYAQNQLGLRGSLRYTPTDTFSADLVVTYDRERNSGTPFLSRSLGSTSVDGIYGAAYLGGSATSAEDLGLSKLGLHRHVWDANFTANWELSDDWSFTTVNGYRHFNALEVFDADGSAAPYLEFAEHAKGWDASHEGRFTYSSPTLRASLGWNYYVEKSYQKVPFSLEEGVLVECTTGLIGTGCVNADNSVPAELATYYATGGYYTSLPYSGYYENQGKNQTWSVFADTTWIPTPRLELTVGARLLHEKRHSGYVSQVPNSTFYYLLYGTEQPLITGLYSTDGETYTATRSFTAVLPRVNVLYHVTPDINLYATVSEGRRSPVVDLSATTDDSGAVVPELNVVEAETVWNYEAGIKGKLGIFSGSLGVYYDDYSNFQVSVYNATTGQSVTESAGSAGNLGVEGEVSAQLASWLTAFANAGYISGGIDDKASNGKYAGSQFRLQPKWQWAAGFNLDLPINQNDSLFLAPSVTYRSKIYFEVPNDEDTSQDPVTLVNARGGLRIAQGKYTLAVWGKNLANKRYLMDAGNTGGSFGYPTYIPAEPRTYGLDVTVRY
ncbi:TonB-dependent receptor [Novosphingobium sp. 1949]|uniref:TonB-dependent receptor n=2 Tax=Novosphingobium organovorum TaxID=2930092 RepID=A0ABT0BGJ2_9SPHN|nr:TonB-dependent receptor [Novosphingobium organovorum]